MSEKGGPAPFRVGIVTTSFPVPSNSSSGIFVKRLVSHLSRDIRPVVLFPCPQMELCRESDESFELDCFNYAPRRWMRLTHRPGGIPDALRRRDPALLLLPALIAAMFFACLRLAGKVDVMHGNWSLPGLVSACAAKLRRRPAIATLRGEDITRAEQSTVYAWILAASLSLNQRTVVVSESMCDLLCRRFPKHARRIEFIPNGVEFRGQAERSAFHSPLRLLTVGSLIRRKRIDTILRGLAQLEHRRDSVLRIVGDGPERGRLETLAGELGITDQVQFTGMIAPDDVSSHLAWADVFVLASESEGRPNAVLEAMATGLPVVATDIPGVRELLHPNAGRLVAVDDWDAMRSAIDALSRDPLHALAMGKAARLRIEADGLTWDAAAGRYASIYRELARAGRN